MPTGREQWFADVLQAGLDTHVLAEPDILAHATPAVLVGALPKDVVVRMLDAALGSGTMSPKAVVAHASPELLAQHIAPGVIWRCIASAAERAGLTATESSGRDDAEARDFLRRALDAALARGVVTPKDVVQHVDARVIVNHLPDALTTKLLEVSLAAGKLDAQLVVDTLGLDQIARHAPTSAVWACLARAGEPAGAAATAGVPVPIPVPEPIPQPSPRPALEFLDDDVASVFVDLDDSNILSVEAVDKERETVVEKPRKAADRKR